MVSVRSLLIAVVLSTFPIAIRAAPAPDVSVSGPGAGISRMYGGSVQLGLSHEEATALAKVTGDELVRQCTLIIQRISAQVALAQKQSISIGAVET